MEEAFQLDTNDGHVIYGAHKPAENSEGKVVIFVHGLTGHTNELIHWLGAKHFSENGFSAIRFGLYSGGDKARRLEDSTVANHAEDLNAVKEYCQSQGYQKIYFVGHSLGGPVILLSDTSDISAVCLWDPTYNTKKLVDSSSYYDEKMNGWFIDWGIKQFWGTKMPEELLKFPDCGELVSKIECPIKIITAEETDSDTNRELYFKHANDPKAEVTIPGASHCFNEEHAPKQLLDETFDWFSKFA